MPYIMTQKDFNAALRAALEGDLLEVANLCGVVGISPKGHHPHSYQPLSINEPSLTSTSFSGKRASI